MVHCDLKKGGGKEVGKEGRMTGDDAEMVNRINGMKRNEKKETLARKSEVQKSEGKKEKDGRGEGKEE